jgi:mannose-6-phosphate isomerase
VVDLLEPVVQPYAWGSTVALAEMLGRPSPSPGPEAELWVGAHPAGPAGLRRDSVRTTLDQVIAAEPERELGPACVARFGPRLPFLLKILAAEQALSIQTHPDAEQARQGFRAENERGIALGDPARNYVDDWPKPEVICAITPFEALAGFREPADAARLIEALGVTELAALAADLRERGDLRQALGRILAWPKPDRPELLDQVVAGCRRLPEPWRTAGQAATKIASDYPGDIGVVASLLLRHLELQPGEALFMPAGGIHAYLRGVGIEVLANSDNVVRAGVTAKHIDVPELLKLVDPSVRVPLLEPMPLSAAVTGFDAGVSEFRLYRLDLGAEPVALPGAGPRLVVCLDGDAVLDDGACPLKLGRGGACFVPASDPDVTVSGPGLVFAAAPGSVST